MSKAIVLRTAACVIAATLFACGGGDSAVAPNTPAVVDKTAKVNEALTEITAGQTAAASSVSSGGTSAPPSSSQSEDAAACVFDEASVSFKCPTHTFPNGMKATGFFQLLDAADKPQSAFDTLTT